MLKSWIRELRMMASEKWLTNDLRKRWKALRVVHRVYDRSRIIQRELARNKRISAWNQGMGKDAGPKLSDAWKDCT